MGQPTRPSRLHHLAHVTRDQAATRIFYEDVLGFPLIATWCEQEEILGARRTYCHTFFELGDGGAIAFFQFANPGDHQEFGNMAGSPFSHVALNCDELTQAGVQSRLEAAGYRPPDMWFIDHGYCKSLYVYDPNRLRVEFTVDSPGASAPKIAEARRNDARSELTRWLNGDHTPNNVDRSQPADVR